MWIHDKADPANSEDSMNYRLRLLPAAPARRGPRLLRHRHAAGVVFGCASRRRRYSSGDTDCQW